MPDRAEVTYEILGTDDHRTGVQTASNAETVLRVQQSFLRPWLPFEYDWNAADAYNLCLFSDLAYRKQEVDDASERLRAGIPPREPENRGISKIWTGLESGRRQLIELASSDLAPGGEFPLMTRSVDTFERYYADILRDQAAENSYLGQRGQGVSMIKKIRVIIIIIALSFLLSACGGGEKSASEVAQLDDKLYLVGIKPKDVKIGLSMQYMSTSDSKWCQKFSAASASFVPTRKSKRFWPYEPSANWFVPNNMVQEVTTSDAYSEASTSTKGSAQVKFQWSVSPDWKHEDANCGYEPIRAALKMYSKTSSVGSVTVVGNSSTSSWSPPSTYVEFNGQIRIHCKVRKAQECSRYGIDGSISREDMRDLRVGGYYGANLDSDTISVVFSEE